MSEDIPDLVILGSGPAGLTAAVYAARADLSPLLIRGPVPGGQLTTTTDVENFPGFPEGIRGPALMEAMEEQARRFGTRFLEGQVSSVNLKPPVFSLQLEDRRIHCRALIVATGASARMLGLPREKELYGRGVSVCATCDAAFFRNQSVVVVGGGDTALEEATHLARFASKVTVVHRRDALRATPPLQRRAENNERIEFRWNARVREILEDSSGVKGVRLEDVLTGESSVLESTGLFVAIGHVPNSALFKNILEMDDKGYLLSRNHCETNIPGVFAAGDVMDHRFRQAVTSAGNGCMAAMQAQDFLADQ